MVDRLSGIATRCVPPGVIAPAGILPLVDTTKPAASPGDKVTVAKIPRGFLSPGLPISSLWSASAP